MPHTEFLAWRIRAQLIPFGWREREGYTARQLAAAGVDSDACFRDWLEPQATDDDDFIASAKEKLKAAKAAKEAQNG